MAFEVLEQRPAFRNSCGGISILSLRTGWNRIRTQETKTKVVLIHPWKGTIRIWVAWSGLWNPEADVTVYGAFGRLDHFLSIPFLPTDPDLAPYRSQIQLMMVKIDWSTDQLVAMRFSQIQPCPMVWFYLSDKVVRDHRGAKYPLHQENYFLKAIWLQWILDQPIQVSLDRGYLVIVY